MPVKVELVERKYRSFRKRLVGGFYAYEHSEKLLRHGVVCSGDEAAAVRTAHGDALAVLVPGIRREGGATHDQRRFVTPAQAVSAGARYLVLGRAVTEAADPAAELRAIGEEMRAAAG